MKKLLHLFYSYKFLILYILFGLTSLVVELISLRGLLSFNLSYMFSFLISWFVGLFTAFWLNITFNFNIPNSKRIKALSYFTIISFLSFLFQFLIRNQINSYGYDMELSRFLISGIFFGFAYILHRKFSFKEYKKVGVAIYADGVEDIKLIFDKISNISDFIHLDIVDKSFNPDCKDVKAYRSEVVRAYWPNKKIEVHIMSRTPSKWIKELYQHVDVIYIHPSIDEPLIDVIDDINSNGVKAGIAIGINEDVQIIDKLLELKKVEHVLLLSITKPGFSGQKFDMETIKTLQFLNNHKKRSEFKVCIDGGVNVETVGYLNAEYVVSGSYVLKAENPIENIMHLQTSGEYVKY